MPNIMEKEVMRGPNSSPATATLDLKSTIHLNCHRTHQAQGSLLNQHAANDEDAGTW